MHPRAPSSWLLLHKSTPGSHDAWCCCYDTITVKFVYTLQLLLIAITIKCLIQRKMKYIRNSMKSKGADKLIKTNNSTTLSSVNKRSKNVTHKLSEYQTYRQRSKRMRTLLWSSREEIFIINQIKVVRLEERNPLYWIINLSHVAYDNLQYLGRNVSRLRR